MSDKPAYEVDAIHLNRVQYNLLNERLAEMARAAGFSVNTFPIPSPRERLWRRIKALRHILRDYRFAKRNARDSERIRVRHFTDEGYAIVTASVDKALKGIEQP